jgi:hypothetical protein
MDIRETMNGIFCEHCGNLFDQFIEIEDGVTWCICCASNDLIIDDEQFIALEKRNNELYLQWLQKEIGRVQARLTP